MSVLRLRGQRGRLAATFAALLMAGAAGACASRGAVPRPFPGAALPPTSPAGSTARVPGADAAGSAVVDTALKLRGTPYRNGGSEPTRGFDCSGLVQWVFAQHGASLPREVREQYEIGKKINDGDVRPGDLVFFHTVSRGPSHVGIALGAGNFVHAPSSRGVVRIETYKSGYWADRWIGARRLTS